MKSLFTFFFLLLSFSIFCQEQKASYALELSGVYMPIKEVSNLEKASFSNINLAFLLKASNKFAVGISGGFISEKGCYHCDEELAFKKKTNGFDARGFVRMNFLTEKKFQIFLQGNLFYSQTKTRVKEIGEEKYEVLGHEGRISQSATTEESILNGTNPFADIALNPFNNVDKAKYSELGFYITPGISYSFSPKFSVLLSYSKLGYVSASYGEGIYSQAFTKKSTFFDFGPDKRSSHYGWDNRLSSLQLGIQYNL